MQLIITMQDGTRHEHKITPAIEVAFEREFKGGIAKTFRDHEKSEHLYWLAWECLRRNGTVVPPFGDKFLDTLESVEIGDDPNPLG